VEVISSLNYEAGAKSDFTRMKIYLIGGICGQPVRFEWRAVRPFARLATMMPDSRRSDKGQYSLQFFQFSSQTSRVLTSIDGAISIGLSVSPDRTAILFTKTVRSGADLMMIENFQ